MALSVERHYGGLPDDPGGYAEDGILGKNILMQPVVPVYDVAGNFAAGKAVGLGNQSNPLKYAYERKEQHQQEQPRLRKRVRRLRLNAVAGAAKQARLQRGQGTFAGFNPITPENAEPTFTNGINENTNNFTDWTWSNTARFVQQLRPAQLRVLAWPGSQRQSRTGSIGGELSNLLNTDLNSRYIQDALGDAATRTSSAPAAQSALLSFFGKVDYNYADKYVASVTVRRDGSSRLGPDHRWGTFPAVRSRLENLEGAVPREQQDPVGRHAAVRLGRHGQPVDPVGPHRRAVRRRPRRHLLRHHRLEHARSSPGFRQTSLGNPDLKWEENKSHEHRRRSHAVRRQAQRRGRRVQPQRRTTCSSIRRFRRRPVSPSPPIVNIGKMKNTGFDLLDRPPGRQRGT